MELKLLKPTNCDNPVLNIGCPLTTSDLSLLDFTIGVAIIGIFMSDNPLTYNHASKIRVKGSRVC